MNYYCVTFHEYKEKKPTGPFILIAIRLIPDGSNYILSQLQVIAYETSHYSVRVINLNWPQN